MNRRVQSCILVRTASVHHMLRPRMFECICNRHNREGDNLQLVSDVWLSRFGLFAADDLEKAEQGRTDLLKASLI